MGEYICPVCGYDKLAELPYEEIANCPSNEICPCCGFEFGFDDDHEGISFDEHREKWFKNGALFWSDNGRPSDWDKVKAKKQLDNLQKIESDMNSEYGKKIKRWKESFSKGRKEGG